jgi:hypothetical protein
MTDELFQGWTGQGGTQNAILSSSDYLSQAQASYNNISDGYYISPAFLDKLTVHVAKNFMDLPKIKVPLILGIWGGKGQGEQPAGAAAGQRSSHRAPPRARLPDRPSSRLASSRCCC